MANTPLIAGIALLCFLVYRYVIFPAFISPLSRIPNAHWSSAISPLWIHYIRWSDRPNRRIHSAHTKHGPIVRLAPNELSINCVEGGLRTVYAGGFEKAAWYPNIFQNYGKMNMFATDLSKPHSARKRMMSNFYSKSYVQGSEALGKSTATILYNRILPRIDDASKKGGEVNMFELVCAATMDIVTSYLFGLKVASNFTQRTEECSHFLGLYHCRQSYNFFPQEIPQITAFFERLGIRLVPQWVGDANKEIEDWTYSMCEGAEKLITDDTASTDQTENEPVIYRQLWNALQKDQEKKGEAMHPLTLTDIRLEAASEMLDHLAAGFDTSSITLTYYFWELSQRPKLQATLRQELLSLSPPVAPTSAPELPDPKAVDALPLLHATLMETLRLHAAIPGAQPRITPATPCSLGDYDNIPPHTRVQAQAYSLHRNPEVFPDPESWVPERWLVEDEKDPRGWKIDQGGEKARWFWAFGSGGRMCIGNNLAMYQMKYIIAAVFSNFTASVVDDRGIEQEDAYTAGPKTKKLILRFEEWDA